MQTPARSDSLSPSQQLIARWRACRQRSLSLVAPLSDADASVQSMEDASPAKWHLAHTTWFLEEFVLLPFVAGYRVHDAAFRFLFNSYYEAVGARQPRARRGLITRPSLAEVVAYRSHVDAALNEAFGQSRLPAEALNLIELGTHHEEQHQELLLTDILHLFAQNPLRPAYLRQPGQLAPAASSHSDQTWRTFEGGIRSIGHQGDGFAFDCETPRHEVLLRPYALARDLVTNRDWIEFIDAGGYREPRHWLSDGWRTVQEQHWQAPLYWEQRSGVWWQMSLGGLLPIDLDAPVSHVSFFEADAFAHWRGARLPTEFEWENAARDIPIRGNFLDLDVLRPMVAGAEAVDVRQLFGDVWEWTASPYLAYPGFRTAPGAVGEYNGKFMNGQFVLRGGSCVTAPGHVRATYRNFFYPHQRWQFTGLRLAKDCT